MINGGIINHTPSGKTSFNAFLKNICVNHITVEYFPMKANIFLNPGILKIMNIAKNICQNRYNHFSKRIAIERKKLLSHYL